MQLWYGLICGDERLSKPEKDYLEKASVDKFISDVVNALQTVKKYEETL